MAGLQLLREMIGRILGRPWILIIIGAALLFLAYIQGDMSPRCAGQDLQPGDLCEYEDGNVTTYEDELSEDRVGVWVMGLTGMIFTVGGIYGFVRKRFRPDETGAPAHGGAPSTPRGGTPF